MGTGSLIFASPHFLTSSYKDSLTSVNDPVTNTTSGLCVKSDYSEQECDLKGNQETYLPNYKYIFILGQLLHGMGAASLITLGNNVVVHLQYKTNIALCILGTTLLDESVTEKMAPIFISIFNSSFVLGPAFG